MNLKLIQEDNLTGEIIAINPKIKKVTLEYEIIKGEIGDYGLDKAKWRLGIEPYNKLLKDLYNIDYITEEEAEALMEDRERTEEEKEEVKKYFSSIIGKENLNHLLNAIKENRQYPQIDYEIKTEIINILGAKEIERAFRWKHITEETAYIERIDFLLKNDDITIKYSIKPCCNLLENGELIENLEKEFKIAQPIFLKDYAEKLCSPVMVEMITPAWSILEKAVLKAKGEME